MAIGLSHGGTNMYTSPALSTEVLVGTVEGVIIIQQSPDRRDWRPVHRSLEDCHISAFVFEQESGLIFAGAFYGGGIFASADGGRTWEHRDDGLTERDVYTVAARRVDGRVRLFVGTQPAHLFCSDDLGQSWREIASLRSVDSMPNWTYPGEPHIAHVKHMNFAPGDPRTVFASVEVGALLKSTDDGESWEDLHVPYPDVHRSVIDPRDGKRIMVTGGAGLWGTSDGGDTWEHWTTPEHEIGGYPDQLVFRPSNPDELFIAAGQKSPGIWGREQSSKTRISRSRDGGRTWEVLGGGLPDLMQPSVEAMCLEETPEGISLFAATSRGSIWWSGDGGDHWSTIVDGLPGIAKGNHRRFTQPAVA